MLRAVLVVRTHSLDDEPQVLRLDADSRHVDDRLPGVVHARHDVHDHGHRCVCVRVRACESMLVNERPQKKKSKIKNRKSKIKTLAGPVYKGVFMKASGGSIGLAANLKKLNCTASAGGAVSHNNADVKASSTIQIPWTAPATGATPVTFTGIIMGMRNDDATCIYHGQDAVVNAVRRTATVRCCFR